MAFKTAKVTANESNFQCVLITLTNTAMSSAGLQSVLQYGTPNRAQAVELNHLLVDTDYQQNMAHAFRSDRATQLSSFERTFNSGSFYDDCAIWTAESDDQPMDNNLLRSFGRPLFYYDAISYIRIMDGTISIADKHNPSGQQTQETLTKLELSIPRYAFLTEFMFPVFPTAIEKTDLVRAEAALTQILIAAQQYKSSHGQYPESMAQVRSAGIADIPMDPFSGKDFVYMRTAKGFTVYSVGEDFKDDGGRQTKYGRDRDKGGDIVLKWEQ